MTRTFFSEKRARQFMDTLKGFESVKLWVGKDGFNQTVYMVKWY